MLELIMLTRLSLKMITIEDKINKGSKFKNV